MKQFRRQGRILYLAEDTKASIHFTPNINWEEYLEYRYNRPKLCIIFDTIEEAQQGAIAFTTIDAFKVKNKVSVYIDVNERRMLGRDVTGMLSK